MTLGNGLVMANTLEDIASGQDNSVEGVLLSGSPNDFSTMILSLCTAMEALRGENFKLCELPSVKRTRLDSPE